MRTSAILLEDALATFLVILRRSVLVPEKCVPHVALSCGSTVATVVPCCRGGHGGSVLAVDIGELGGGGRGPWHKCCERLVSWAGGRSVA